MGDQMRYKYILMILISLSIIIGGCKEKESDLKVESIQPSEQIQSEDIINTLIPIEYASIAELITQYDSMHSTDRYKLYFIDKIHMEIPGGENWFVTWVQKIERSFSYNSYIYINNYNVIDSYNICSMFNIEDYSSFDIMAEIPGTQIGKLGTAIGDYNKDGFDEILSYSFYATRYLFEIIGYDKTEAKKVNYIEIPFVLIDREKGPAPVKFLTYKGIEGFQIYSISDDLQSSLEGPSWSFYFCEPETSWFNSLESYNPE